MYLHDTNFIKLNLIYSLIRVSRLENECAVNNNFATTKKKKCNNSMNYNCHFVIFTYVIIILQSIC